MPAPSLVTPELIAQLQGLQLRARTVVESVLSGTHRSTRRGFSVEFAEHRDYVPGDDLRYIDWKLFARRDRYYVRQFEDETRFKLMCVLDVSPSMTYRSTHAAISKLDYAAVLAASLLWLVQQQRDEFGLATFSTSIQQWFPPTLQSGWYQQLLEQLEANVCQSGQATGSNNATNKNVSKTSTSASNAMSTNGAADVSWQPLHEIAERLPPRSLIMLLTDGFGDVAELGRALQHVQHRRQDIRLIHILDPAELDFPFQEPTRFLGLETGEQLALPGRSVRESYLDVFREFLQSLESTCRERHSSYHRVTTSDSLTQALRQSLSLTDH